MITASGMIPIVGLPEMRRGSLTFVTRPSTLAPAGIKVCPFTTTGCVTLARKGSPALLLNVASVVSSRTINAVPAGTGPFVCAANTVASNVQGNNIHFFMGPPKLELAFDCSPEGTGGQAAHSTWGTTGGKRREGLAEWT